MAKGDVFVIHNAQGHSIGAFTAEEGTGADRLAGAIASRQHVDEISCIKMSNLAFLVIDVADLDRVKDFLAASQRSTEGGER